MDFKGEWIKYGNRKNLHWYSSSCSSGALRPILRPWYLVGGHREPISIVGDRLSVEEGSEKWKRKKNSDIIITIIPHRNPLVTNFVCNLWYVPSRTISRIHWIIVRIITVIPININSCLTYLEMEQWAAEKEIPLVWRCHQLLCGFLDNGYLDKGDD